MEEKTKFCKHCGEKIPEDAIYDRNLTEHWINGEDGEKLNLGEHELGEYKPGDMVTCFVCGSEISFWTDGGADVCNYDERYNLIRSTSYFSDGSLIFDYVMEYRYNEKNAISYEATYQNGRLYEETEYLENEIIKNFYEEDGYCLRIHTSRKYPHSGESHCREIPCGFDRCHFLPSGRAIRL